MASGSACFNLVRCTEKSFSPELYISLAATSIPYSGASSWMIPKAPVPKSEDSYSTATFCPFIFSLKYLNNVFIWVVSVAVVRKMNSFPCSTILCALEHGVIWGILEAAVISISAMVQELFSAPISAVILFWFTSFCVTVTDFAGTPSSSSFTSSIIYFPSMPPASLISFTAISTALACTRPLAAAFPVRGPTHPSTTVSFPSLPFVSPWHPDMVPITMAATVKTATIFQYLLIK